MVAKPVKLVRKQFQGLVIILGPEFAQAFRKAETLEISLQPDFSLLLTLKNFPSLQLSLQVGSFLLNAD